MSVLNTTIKPFNATAYKDGKFVDISDETVKGKWAVFLAGPTQRAVVQVRVSGGQAEVQYAPTTLAYKIQNMEITPEGVGRNAAELLRKIKALQYWVSHPGEVCPAKWEEGAETLAPSLDLVGKI